MIFKKFIPFVVIVFASSLFLTCKKENMCDCIKRTGSINSETRQVSGFNEIVVENNVNVFITQDSVCEVKVEAGKNIIPLIKTEIENGVLFVRNKNRCNWTRSYDKPLNVYIKMPVIKYITSNGTGDIKGMNTFTTNNFDLELNNAGNIELWANNSKITSHVFGSGDLTLHGITGEHACNIGGSSYLYCTDLKTDYTWVHTFSSGNCFVDASNLLIVLIDRIGDIYCYGNPTNVVKTIKGDGKLYLR